MKLGDWPQREDTKGSYATGYRVVWENSSENEPWHPLLVPVEKKQDITALLSDLLSHRLGHVKDLDVQKEFPNVLKALAALDVDPKDPTTHKLNSDVKHEPGLYEFAISYGRNDLSAKRFKVYIGKASDLHKRQAEYLGSEKEMKRIRPFFEHALKNNNTIWRRYVYLKHGNPKVKATGSMKKKLGSHKDLLAYQLETRFLSIFDYAFNGDDEHGISNGTNPPKRLVYIKQSNFLCCFPSDKPVIEEYRKY